jgi:hypothetical protein
LNAEALAHWGLELQKHIFVAIFINLTLLLVEILPLATANLAKPMCMGLHAANTILESMPEGTSCQDPLLF